MHLIELFSFLASSRTTVMTILGLLTGAHLATIWGKRKKPPNIVVSPRTLYLPGLSQQERDELPYPPNALLGARDVASPYGSLRVYEWGPETGRKALLVHGISTPCLALGEVAECLVQCGCRVMLFDLFGRGYSDGPTGIPHDIRLFITQILLVLSSSPLSWTGSSSGRFSLVGYSLGGAIAASFTSHFPQLISSLVLIAPAGLLRPHHISRTSRMIYSEGLIPEPILNFFVKRRLRTPLAPTPPSQPIKDDTELAASVAAEVPNLESSSPVRLSKNNPQMTIVDAVNFQIDHHRAFVPAFMSSIRYGPIMGQHVDWRRLGRMLTDQKNKETVHPPVGRSDLQNGRVLIILGNADSIIIRRELEQDATEVLEGNVEYEYIDAGHEAPIVRPREVVSAIGRFWKL